MNIDQEIYRINNTQEIVIRSATSEDAMSLMKHRAITSGETHFMARYPEECEADVEKNAKYSHRAYMGISIQEKYCGCGLGSRMVQIAVEQAKKNGFEQLELGVFSDNERAIRLYTKMGFQKCGVQPHAFKLKDGVYCDELLMVRFLL